MTPGPPYRVAPPSVPVAKCPHCHAETPPLAHKRLRWVCSACGGPVLRGLEPAKVNPETARLLREAVLVLNARKMALRTMVRGAMALLVGAAVLLGIGGQAIVTYLVTGLLLTVLVGVARAVEDDKRAARAHALVDQAWARAAAVVARELRGPILVTELAKAMSLTPPDAEHLLAEAAPERPGVSVEDGGQGFNFGADAEGRLSSPPPPPPSASAPTKHGSHE